MVTPASPRGSAATGAEGQQGGTLIAGRDGGRRHARPPPLLHHHVALQVIQEVTETVIQLEPGTRIEPILLTSIEVSDDGLLYTMNVREGITFHNGDPLDAAAIAFSHERANNDLAAFPGQFYGATWEVIDPLTVQMIMPEANSGVMLILAFRGCGIVPPATWPRSTTT